MTSNLLRDTISFPLTAEKTVVNNTVKISAEIAAIITPDLTESVLKEKIREMMRSLISTTTDSDGNKQPVVWQFSNISRSSHASGMEEIKLTASARVHESDNYSLDKRSRAASKEGIRITEISVDTTPPRYMIEETESMLRLSIISSAQTELKKINDVMLPGVAKYGINEIIFSNVDGVVPNRNMRNMASFSASASYGSGMDDDGSLGNAVKVTLRATIFLRNREFV